MQHDNGTGSTGGDDTRGDGWDAFDWQTWGEEQQADDSGQDAEAGEPGQPAEPGAGRWVSEGGVMRWERPGEIDEEEALDAASEASSPWAKDEIELPPGAPEVLRARAARAWLLRQRTLELDAMGVLLLERRRLHEAGSAGEAEGEAPAEDPLPLALALAEHQAAIEEYERLLAEMDEIASHSGPARVLVEFYLGVMERLAELAAQPEAPAEFADALLAAQVEGEENVQSGAAPPSPHSTAVWRGRAEAALQVRRRIERVTAPEPED